MINVAFIVTIIPQNIFCDVVPMFRKTGLKVIRIRTMPEYC
jgi:hypothetical protein